MGSYHTSGISKLRRVLLAYSLHNPEIEYCQVRASKDSILLILRGKTLGISGFQQNRGHRFVVPE